MPEHTTLTGPEPRSALLGEDDTILEISGLRTQFTTRDGVVRAVDGVDLRVPAGKTVCVVGESGCGKSVTARSVLGLVEPPGKVTDGHLWWRSPTLGRVDLNALDPKGSTMRRIRAREISMVFQEPIASLSPMYTVGAQLVEMLREHKGLSKEAARDASIALLERVGIPRPASRVDNYPWQMSGGMCQRIMIAMALACEPALLIADEPTTALDVTIQARILDLFSKLQAETGMSLLFITHDLGVVAEIADEVAVMYLGRVVEQAPVEELFANPKHPYTRALLRSVPRLGRAHGRKLATIRGQVPHGAHRPSGCSFRTRCEVAIEGLCDVIEPVALTTAGHLVECHRWDEDTLPQAVEAGLPPFDANATAEQVRTLQEDVRAASEVATADLAAGTWTPVTVADADVPTATDGPTADAEQAGTGGPVAGPVRARATEPAPARAADEHPRARVTEPTATATHTPDVAAPSGIDATRRAAPLLEVRDLSMRFPVKSGWFGRQQASVHALTGVNLTIRPGETLGLVGESGCGKTTLGRCIVRSETPSEGQIWYSPHERDRQDVALLPERRLRDYQRDVRMIFQDPFSSLNPRMTLRQIIGDPLIAHRIAKGSELEDRVAQMMRRVGLAPEYMDRYPHAFSGGQRQRVNIARALILQPRLVVADEAVSALDVSVRAQILNLLRDLQEELDLTYLFISHDLSVVESICDRVAVMYLGKVVELADTEDVFLDPRHPYSEALLSAVPATSPEQRGGARRIRLSDDLPDPVDPPPGCYFQTRCRYAVEGLCDRADAPPTLDLVSPADRAPHLSACLRHEELNLAGIRERTPL
ncbi:ABC transporter ATP-binding protein [Occultella aeris]|uniref:Oligopeptide transport ATP-binding protein OppD n=1 Tax=Occultella aeris TaxID=2761496 RepID=A0A7M4DEY4_9MICO|nr:ABC transporter ATP-binding protein [Occultella aeris]VZO35477.1 Oligopeptide transport ATP-binding protein OppD [Occultella aeris]